ncbi:MAG: glycerophosphodiester phosphodiesterase [Vicinamibacterales bacterium]
MPRRDGRAVPAVFDSRCPLVFGHRGGLARGPENTLTAFARAMAFGADGFECDVRRSADGVPVVIHDPTLDRTTDATGPVRARTAAELAAVDATCRFTPALAGDEVPAPEGIPALTDALARFPAARVIVEIKDPEPGFADDVVAVLRRLDALSRVCVGSFHQQVLDRVRAAAPDVTTSASPGETRWLLVRARSRWPFAVRPRFRALQVPVSAGRLRVVSGAFVGRAHREGATVQVWTVNDPLEVRRLLALGVDGIISDRPDAALKERDAMAPPSSLSSR